MRISPASLLKSATTCWAICLLVFLAGCQGFHSPPALTIKDADKRGNSIGISDIQADVKVIGRVAETTLMITVTNSSDRVQEAMLDLPLPEGASISGYALDVNGTMRKGVIVDKNLGRVAFENTIRQGIDPGLLEKTSGNRFRTRIYPVPAKGSKHVMLSYTEPLRNVAGATDTLHYTLPISLSKRVRNFRLTMSSTNRATVMTPVRKMTGLVTEDDGELKFKASNYRAKDLHFHIIQPNGQSDVIVERGGDGKHYFYLNDNHGRTTSYPRRSPREILIVWDASRSGHTRDIAKELKWLGGYFYHFSRAPIRVRLHLLRDQLSDAGSFQVTDGNWDSLKNYLKQIDYDGATRLSSLKLNSKNYDHQFYFGDGLSTFGHGDITVGSRPIFTVNTARHANHQLLAYIARKSRGAYLNLRSRSVDETIGNLTHQQLELLKVTGAGVSAIQIDSAIGTASASGRIHQSATTLKLHYGVNGKVHFTRNVKINKIRHQSHSKVAARLWAQHQVNKLSLNKKRNRSEIVRLATTHHLVTDFTSLIVLDRVTDYVRYRIVPPEAKLRKQYYAMLKDDQGHQSNKRADLNDLYQSWKEIVQWHGRKYPLPKSKTLKPTPSSYFLGGGAVRGSRSSSPDFISPVAFTQIPGIPAGSVKAVSNIATAGLRSGDFATTRNSIDAILNNPRRSNKLPTGPIKIKSWKPQKPYTRSLASAQRAGKPLLPVYQRWKKKYHKTPGFYLDVAEFFAQHGQQTMARRILSNLAEISPESPEMLRVLAHRYSHIGEYRLAEMLLREVLEMRPEEPQSHRDLALVLVHRKHYQEASDLLWEVVSRAWSDSRWGSRFQGIQMISINEWNALRKRHGAKIKLRSSQKRFIHMLDADIRIVIDWDTDNSDMDLWVTNPHGEKCYYSNPTTRHGDRISRDMTQGRGPEEFMIRKASKGKYKIQVNYYASRQQTHIGPTTLHATVITNWGRSNEKRKHITLRLENKKQVINVGEIEFEEAK